MPLINVRYVICLYLSCMASRGAASTLRAASNTAAKVQKVLGVRNFMNNYLIYECKKTISETYSQSHADSLNVHACLKLNITITVNAL